MNHEQLFIASLVQLARSCGIELDEDLIARYDRHLAPLGYDRLCRAIESIFDERSSRDPFPSIREIREKIVTPIDPETEAIEAAGRIIQAVSRYGWNNGESARAFIGELGWVGVQRFGGWSHLCQSLKHDNTPTIQAQLRKTIAAAYVRNAQGLGNVAPQLPETRATSNHGLVRASDGFLKLLGKDSK